MLQERSPEMRKAVGFLKELSADERTRMLAETHENARRDEASRMRGSRKAGHFDVVRRMLTRGKSVDEIVEDTGVSRDEIEKECLKLQS